jgi:uncharacterized membrane protein YraQ (UPF0718 family)
VLGAIVFGVIVGVLMAVVFRGDEERRTAATMAMPDPPPAKRPLWQNAAMLMAMIAFLVFSDWFNPGDKDVVMGDGTRFQATLQYETLSQYDLRMKEAALGHAAGEVVRFDKSAIASIQDVDNWVVRIHHIRWYLAGLMGALVVVMSLAWLDKPDFLEWMDNTWIFAKLLVPLLFGGVFIVGFLGALVPEEQVARWVGGNSFLANLNASVIGCLFYFATLTEIPILEALMKNGMGSGPALALLLAGPALSIPSILVIRSVLGNLKTVAFVILVVIMSTVVGMGYGTLFPENPVLNTPSGTPAAVATASH